MSTDDSQLVDWIYQLFANTRSGIYKRRKLGCGSFFLTAYTDVYFCVMLTVAHAVRLYGIQSRYCCCELYSNPHR